MKRVLAVGCACALAFLTTTCSQGAKAPAKKSDLTTDLDKISYAIGMDIAKSLKGFPGELDIATVQQGLDDAFRGNPTLLTPEQAQEVQETAFAKMRGEQETKNKESGEKNLKEGSEFLEKNKSAAGVKVTPSGLQYQVITQGKGAKPKATDVVTVNYKGTLIDGKEFDSSYKRGQPATFPLNGVIPAWTEGLQLMAVGSKYKLFVPPALGYGERGAGGDIGPNATLIFEVELLSIGQPKPDAAPAAAK